MRPPEELDNVPWSELSDAAGDAESVPTYIRTMYEAYGEPGTASEDAVSDLLCCLYMDWRDTTPYQIAPALVPFLVHGVLHLPAHRVDLLGGLATVAVQARQPGPVSAEASAALREAAAELLPCLSEPDVTVRLALLHLLALTGVPVAGTVLDAVAVAREHDGDAEVRAAALTALASLDPDPERALAREREALADSEPALRLTASLAALRRSGPPYPKDLVDGLAVDGAEAEDPVHPAHFMGEPRRRQQTIDALSADADAALAVAERWIARGDLDRRGAVLAAAVDRCWRDREADVVPLLVAALPHARTSAERRLAVQALGRTAERIPAPGSEVGDALLPYAEGADPHVRDAALAALARCGDARAWDERFTLPPAALLRAADRLDALPQIGAALLQASRDAVNGPPEESGAWPNDRTRFIEDLQGVIELMGRLTPGLAVRLVPELTDLLWHHQVDRAAAAALGGIRLTGAGPSGGDATRDGIAADGAAPDPLTGPELVALLRTLARATSADNPAGRRIAAAVAVARLTDQAMSRPGIRLRDGGQGARDQAVRLLGQFLASEKHASTAVGLVDRLGPVGLPLLPQVAAQLAARSGETRLSAAVAHWRISGDPAPAVPVATQLAEEGLLHLDALERPERTSAGLAALELLAEIGVPPERLRGRLDDIASSPARFVRHGAGSPLSPGEDERLRSAARVLLHCP